MPKILTNLIGLLLGAAVGWLLTPTLVAAAQAVVSYRIDRANAACWDQSGLTLAEANALRAEVSYDAPIDGGAGGSFAPTLVACTGLLAPWQCNVTLPMPMALQTIGRHRTIVRTMTVDPVDGSLSPPTIAADFLFDLRTAPLPPPPGTNGRLIIIKIVPPPIRDRSPYHE